MNGEEVAHELINVLLVTLGVQSNLLGAMCNRASINNVANASVLVLSCLDIGCFLHTLDIVGEKFKAPVLNALISLWLSHSPKTRLSWKEQTGNPWPHLVRWSHWEINNQ